MLPLAACSTEPVSPDAAEFANAWRSNLVPKSSPSALIGAFDRFCVSRPSNVDATLRRAGYVPVPGSKRGDARAYIVDDRRPAVAVGDQICMVEAKSRTGQTDRMQGYMRERFPDTRPLSVKSFGMNIEQAWSVGSEAIVATQRERDVYFYKYRLIFYQHRTGGAE